MVAMAGILNRRLSGQLTKSRAAGSSEKPQSGSGGLFGWAGDVSSSCTDGNSRPRRGSRKVGPADEYVEGFRRP